MWTHCLTYSVNTLSNTKCEHTIQHIACRNEAKSNTDHSCLKNLWWAAQNADQTRLFELFVRWTAAVNALRTSFLPTRHAILRICRILSCSVSVCSVWLQIPWRQQHRSAWWYISLADRSSLLLGAVLPGDLPSPKFWAYISIFWPSDRECLKNGKLQC